MHHTDLGYCNHAEKQYRRPLEMGSRWKKHEDLLTTRAGSWKLSVACRIRDFGFGDGLGQIGFSVPKQRSVISISRISIQ